MKLKNNNIVFIHNGMTDAIYKEFYPKLASEFIPEWYKKTQSYMFGEKKPGENGTTTATIKKCMPVFDAIVSGYIICTYVDIYIDKISQVIQNGTKITTENISRYRSSSGEPITFHPIVQAPLYPNADKHFSVPKFENPWIIKTPPGYSSLFTQPFHRELPFKIMEGIVDTDIYQESVHFPFLLNDPNFEGLIPAGTPIAQVIPFKRDSWTMKIGDEKDFQNIKKNGNPIGKVFFDAYKNFIRQPKIYK